MAKEDTLAQAQEADYYRLRLEQLERENAQLRAKVAVKADAAARQSAVKPLREQVNVRDMSVAERRRTFRQTFILYPRLQRMVSLLEECRASRHDGDPRSAFVYGQPGAGKSSLKLYFTHQVQYRERDDANELNILSVDIAAPATPKSVASAMLWRMGDRYWDRGTTSVLLGRVAHFVRRCKVELIVLDEFHHLIKSGSSNVLHETSEWLKSLINQTNIPVVAFGMETGLAVLETNQQLGRRFPVREELKPFSIDTPEGYQEFARFLYLVDQRLPLAEPSNLHLSHRVVGIYNATGGIVGHVMDLLLHAMVHAVELGREAIEDEDLAHGFERIRHSAAANIDNPFLGGSRA